MKEKKELELELKEIKNMKDEALKEREIIEQRMNRLQLHALRNQALIELKTYYESISELTPEEFGEFYDLPMEHVHQMKPQVNIVFKEDISVLEAEEKKEEKESELGINEEGDEEKNVLPAQEENELSKDVLKAKAQVLVHQLNDKQKYIIRTIGKTGISRNQELFEYILNEEAQTIPFNKKDKSVTNEMSATVKSLRDQGFLVSEKVNLESKGGYNFQVYVFSILGKEIYSLLTNEPLAITERNKMIARYRSLERGYIIKDSAVEFRAMGYNVQTEQKDVRFELPDGRKKHFDMLLEKDGETLFVQVDRGKNKEEDFVRSLKKTYDILTELGNDPIKFHFICPNEQSLYTNTKKQFLLWIKQHIGYEAAAGKLQVHFTTFDKVKKHQKNLWDNVQF